MVKITIMVIIWLFIFINLAYRAVGQEPPKVDHKKVLDTVKGLVKDEKDIQAPVVNINLIKPKLNVSKNLSVITSTTSGPIIQNNANSYIESGAVMRGVFVFVAITLLFLMYLVFKTYRKGNRKQVAIKKYGVRARRTDTEMEPLHLDDEEEDETLFVRNVNDR